MQDSRDSAWCRFPSLQVLSKASRSSWQLDHCSQKTRKVPVEAQITNCVVTVAGISGNVPTRRQAGSRVGNLSKYIYVLFSPQRHLWSTVSFSDTSIPFILPPSIKFPWNNQRLIWSTGKPGKSVKERKILICFLCHHILTCFSNRDYACFKIPDTHFLSEKSVWCRTVPTSAVYPCLKLLSNNIMSDRMKRLIYDCVYFTNMQQSA